MNNGNKNMNSETDFLFTEDIPPGIEIDISIVVKEQNGEVIIGGYTPCDIKSRFDSMVSNVKDESQIFGMIMKMMALISVAPTIRQQNDSLMEKLKEQTQFITSIDMKNKQIGDGKINIGIAVKVTQNYDKELVEAIIRDMIADYNDIMNGLIDSMFTDNTPVYTMVRTKYRVEHNQ